MTEPGNELEVHTPRTIDLRNAVTDSWADMLEPVADLAAKISNSDFVPAEYRGKVPQIAATILYGRDLGFPPLTALSVIHPIQGKPSLSAEAMRALILQAGHEIVVAESSSSRVILKGRRRGSDEWTSVEWTMADAQRAGLGGPSWKKYPRQMLAARATAELARLIFADVVRGLRAAEELVDDIDQVTEVAAPEPARTSTVQRKRAARKPKPEPAAPPPERKRVDLPAPKSAPVDDAGGGDTGPTDSPDPVSAIEQQQDEIRHLSEEHRTAKAGRQGPAKDDPAAAVPAAGDDDDRDDGEVVDAEIVTGRDTGPQITAAQRAAIQMHFRRLNVDDRDEYLLIINVLLDLEPGTIGSTNELRGSEPQRVLKILETLKDRDALDQRLNGQDQLA